MAKEPIRLSEFFFYKFSFGGMLVSFPFFILFNLVVLWWDCDHCVDKIISGTQFWSIFLNGIRVLVCYPWGVCQNAWMDIFCEVVLVAWDLTVNLNSLLLLQVLESTAWREERGERDVDNGWRRNEEREKRNGRERREGGKKTSAT